MGVPSAYRFVPLSQKVLRPEWGWQATHDVPFQKGISGWLDVRLTAKTPLLVGDGGEEVKRFVRYGDEVAIPGSTWKGMLRAVVEIASFGKFGTFVTDRRLAVRDLHNALVYRQHMTESDQGGYRARSQGGWLEVDEDGRWWIRPCKVARVKIDDLGAYHRKGHGNVFLGARQSGVRKYEQWKAPLELTFDLAGSGKQDDGLVYDLAANLGRGGLTGRLVLTGQPSAISNKGAKKKEFVFHEAAGDEARIEISDRQRQEFEWIHSQGERHGLPEPNEEWAYQKERLKRGERVPVFYLLEKGTSRFRGFGLAQMFRLGYRYTLHEAIAFTSEDHFSAKDPRPDLAELLFGRVFEDPKAKPGSLRGRVSCEPMWLEGEAKTSRLTTLLNGPKPSFYPYYMAQPHARGAAVPEVPVPGDRKPKPGYRTLMDEGAELAGWKRYPARDQATPWPPNPPGGKNSTKVNVTIEPLEAGATFTGRIHVHNLLREELGALVWAITWGGREELRHSLGMGKPFGFGQVVLEVLEAELEANEGEAPSLEEARGAYESYMEERFREWSKGVCGWSECDQLQNLMALANPAESRGERLRHPDLGNKEFAGLKKEGTYLPRLKDVGKHREEQLFYRLSPEEREQKRAREREVRAKQAAEAEQRRKEQEAEEAKRAELAKPVVERFNAYAEGETEVGNLWSKAKQLSDEVEAAELPRLAEACRAHAVLGPQIESWEAKYAKEKALSEAEFKALQPKRQKKAQSNFERVELLRSWEAQ